MRIMRAFRPTPGVTDSRTDLVTNWEEPIILIPEDHKRGSYEARVRRAVRWLWSRGIYPGPSAMNVRLHGKPRRDLNGRECAWRNDEMKNVGISRQRAKMYRAIPERNRLKA